MRNRLLLMAALIVALIAGCGVPTSSGVFTDGPASGGSGAGSDAKPPPPGPTGINDPAIFIENYLGAIAGKSESDAAGLSGALTPFMSAATKNAWHMNKQINVIRVISRDQKQLSGGTYDVFWTVQVLGVFTPSLGTLQPPPIGPPQRKILSFHVSTLVNDQGGRLLQFTGDDSRSSQANGVPDGLYLSENALFDYYRQQPVYFWDSSGEVLIPELRYVPLTYSPLQQETTLVNWVLGGPQELGSAAKALVTTTLLDPQVSQDGDRLVIDLAQPTHLDPTLPDKLAIQLRWSLLDMGSAGSGPPKIELLIDRQRQSVVDDEGSTANFRAANPISSNSVPTEYAIGNGTARRLDGPQPPILTSPANANVVYAAVGRSQANAALVRKINGHSELWWRASRTASFKRIANGSSMSRPDIVANGVFVIIDGRLRYFGGGHDQAITVGLSGLTDLSVAPDGHRFALVAGGQLYTSVLSWQNDVASMTTPARQLRTKLDSVTTVAWSRQKDLAIGGLENGVHTLKETNSDGVDNSGLTSLSVAVSSVAAYPFDPVDFSTQTSIMFDAGDVGSRVGVGGASAPLVWGTSGGGPLGKPRSPFFGD